MLRLDYLTDMSFEITKREVLFSVAIICIMLVIGFMISGAIDTSLENKYAEYNTALQIDGDADLFGYGMRTDVGDAFVYGDLVAVDPISIPDIDGEYATIKRQKQKYTMHTRTVTYEDSEGHTHTRTEHYWTWDNAGAKWWNCERIAYLGYEFDYGTIDFPSAKYLTTIYESSHIRYEYYVRGTKYVGTLKAKLAGGTITDTWFFDGYDIEGAVKHLESGWQKVLFWIVWFLLTGGSVFLFYYIDNKWLE